MNHKRFVLAIIGIGLGFFVTFGGLVLNWDAAVIRHGIYLAGFFRALALIGLGMAIAISAVAGVAFKRPKISEKELVLLQLRGLDFGQAREMVDQLQKMETYFQRFSKLYLDGNVHVFEEVGQSLRLAEKQMLQNAKTLINRLNVEGEVAQIQKKVLQNEKILGDVKLLLNEMVNYLESKTASGNSPLESVTESLKLLNDTLGGH